MIRKQNKIYKKYKKNGFNDKIDKIALDRLKNDCYQASKNAKENYLKDMGNKLADPTTGLVGRF